MEEALVQIQQSIVYALIIIDRCFLWLTNKLIWYKEGDGIMEVLKMKYVEPDDYFPPESWEELEEMNRLREEELKKQNDKQNKKQNNK